MNRSISVDDFSDSVIIPAAVLDAVWSKACDILSLRITALRIMTFWHCHNVARASWVRLGYFHL